MRDAEAMELHIWRRPWVIRQLPKLAVVCGAALVACCFPSVGHAAEEPATAKIASPVPTVDMAQIEQLVSQLGDRSFKRRQQAHRELLGVGAAAKEPLLAAIGSKDPEVRYRAEKILLVVLDLDFANRLEAFSSDVGGTSDYQLPMWDRYRGMFDDTRHSRELFAAMQRAEGSILQAAATDPPLAASMLETRCEEVLETHNAVEALTRRDLTVASVAAFLFVATAPDVPVTTQTGQYLTHFSSYRSFQTAATGGNSKAQLLHKLMAQWIEFDLVSDVTRQVASQNLMMAMRLQMPEALVPAMQLLRSNAVPAQNLQHAIVAIAKFGTKEHLPLLTPLLTNETLLSNPPDQFTIQVGDVALAAVIHLHGKKVEDFGFVHVRRGSDKLFEPQTLGFASQAERRAAFDKWQAAQAAEPPTEPVTEPADAEPVETETTN